MSNKENRTINTNQEKVKVNKFKQFIDSKILKKNDSDFVVKKEDFNDKNVFEVRDLNFWYDNGNKQALFDINLDIKRNNVTSLIGPSGCGKSTFLRMLNRMHDLVEGTSHKGNIFFNGDNIYSKKLNVLDLRTKVGMVFQKATPFPLSIYENVVFGLKNQGLRDRKILDKIVESSLKSAALWDEVKNELDNNAMGLSGGQQQRLCIARAVALAPTVLLMDEPTSALDPIATSKIEELILELRKNFTIIIVTHSMAQAQRISDETVFFYDGRVIESGKTKQIFMKPKEKRTKDYVNGKIG
ncbi:MAG: phosphate ABC transporter ATP-binding protein [Mycoplasma sp.]|nr:phosphate ABC transporter ATP-binding protein [Mycoplasma sp.]